MSSRTSPPQLFLRGIALPIAAFAAVGILAASEFLSQRELQAAPVERPHDPDGDGLVNPQEVVLGTNCFQADTDGDGFSDLEELARESSPLFPQSVPEGERMRVGMSCSGDGTRLRVLIALYLPDGDLRNKSFKAGMLLRGRMITLTEAYLLNHAQIKLHPARSPSARIAVVDLPVAARIVKHHGDLSLFATLGDKALGIVQAADSIHLLAFGASIVLQTANPQTFGTTALTLPGQQTGGVGAIGSIYVPLTVGGDPGAWTPGQVCVQQTALIGVSGSLMTQQVVTAECQDGWDGYCPSNCAGTIGNTYTTIDPIALIGG